MEQLRIALVEEEVMVRTALADCIARMEGCTVVLCTAHGSAFVEAAERCAAPHIAVVSISTLKDREVEWPVTMAWANSHWEPTLLLALTCERGRATLQQAVRVGADGFVCRATDGKDQLLIALNELHANGRYFPADVLAILAEDAPAPAPRLADLLAPKQRMVLDHACARDLPSRKVLASRLGRKRGTVDTHLTNLFRIAGVGSMPGLVLAGRKEGFGRGTWAVLKPEWVVQDGE